MELQKKIKAYGFDVGDEIIVWIMGQRVYGHLYKVEEDAIMITVINDEDLDDMVIIPWDKVETLKRCLTGDEEKFICESRSKFGKFGKVEEEIEDMSEERILLTKKHGLLNLMNKEEEEDN